jgi:hypothetical protein
MSLPIASDGPLPLLDDPVVPMFAFNGMRPSGENPFRALLADVHPWTFEEDGFISMSGPCLITTGGVMDPFDVFMLCHRHDVRHYSLVHTKATFSPHTSRVEVAMRHSIPRAMALQPCPMNMAFATEVLTTKHLRLELDGGLSVPIHSLTFGCETFEDPKGKLWVPWTHLKGMNDEDRGRLVSSLYDFNQLNARVATVVPEHLRQSKVLLPKTFLGGKGMSLHRTGDIELYNPAHCLEIPIEICIHH